MSFGAITNPATAYNTTASATAANTRAIFVLNMLGTRVPVNSPSWLSPVSLPKSPQRLLRWMSRLRFRTWRGVSGLRLPA